MYSDLTVIVIVILFGVLCVVAFTLITWSYSKRDSSILPFGTMTIFAASLFLVYLGAFKNVPAETVFFDNDGKAVLIAEKSGALLRWNNIWRTASMESYSQKETTVPIVIDNRYYGLVFRRAGTVKDYLLYRNATGGCDFNRWATMVVGISSSNLSPEINNIQTVLGLLFMSHSLKNAGVTLTRIEFE